MFRGIAKRTLLLHLSEGGNMAPKDLQVNFTKQVKGRMFSVQSSLPRFPVPPLEQTLRKYLLAVKPLVSDEDFEKTKAIVAEFGSSGGLGERLQQKLEERANHHINWLEDWWLYGAYLNVRVPVVTYVSPAVVFPMQDYCDEQGQLRYAAKVIGGLLDYKTMIDNQTLPVDMMGKDPLCMVQYYKVLSSCRVPGKKVDSVLCYPPNEPNPPTHIIVTHNNQFFRMDVYDENGEPLPMAQICAQLKHLVNQSRTAVPQVGMLTSDDRDTWANVYNTLIQDNVNKASFEEIQRAIFVLCLDQAMPQTTDSSAKLSQAAAQMNHGGGSEYNSGNRWFDKTLQIIIGADGVSGLNYEHSTAEGPTIISMIDHMLKFVKKDFSDFLPSKKTVMPKKLTFNITTEVETAIQNSGEKLNKIRDDLEVRAVHFTEYGKDFVKSLKMSPDAFLQVCYQLAFYRIHAKHPPTYESGSLRRFQHGRTDTIRSCTIDSSNFARAMDNKNISATEKVNLLKKAVNTHRNCINETVRGQAIDRHLLGLRMIAVENNMTMPDLFRDTTYQWSQHYRLSTSQVAAAEKDAFMCFGPVVNDGYGVCYNPHKSGLSMGISAWNSYPNSSAKIFGNTITESLVDMKKILT